MKKVEVAILSYKKYNVNVFYIFVLLTDPSFLCLAAWCQTRIPCTQQGWPTKHLNNGRPFTLVSVSSFALKISNKTNPKHKTGLSVGKFTSSCSILQAHNYIRTCSMQGGRHFFSQETCLVRYALPPPHHRILIFVVLADLIVLHAGWSSSLFSYMWRN